MSSAKFVLARKPQSYAIIKTKTHQLTGMTCVQLLHEKSQHVLNQKNPPCYRMIFDRMNTSPWELMDTCTSFDIIGPYEALKPTHNMLIEITCDLEKIQS